MIPIHHSDAGRRKNLRGPVVIGGDNLPSPIWNSWLIELPNIGGRAVVPASLTDQIKFFKLDKSNSSCTAISIEIVPRGGPTIFM